MELISFELPSIGPVLRKHIASNTMISFIIHPISSEMVAIQTSKPFIMTSYIKIKNNLTKDLCLELKKSILIVLEETGYLSFQELDSGVRVYSTLSSFIFDKSYEMFNDIDLKGTYSVQVSFKELERIIKVSSSLRNVSKALSSELSRVYIGTDNDVYNVYSNLCTKLLTTLKIEVPIIIPNQALKLFLSYSNSTDDIVLNYNSDIIVLTNTTNMSQLFAHNGSVFNDILKDVSSLFTLSSEEVYSTKLFAYSKTIDNIANYAGTSSVLIDFYSNGEFRLSMSGVYSFKSTDELKDNARIFSTNLNALFLSAISKIFKSEIHILISRPKGDILCLSTPSQVVLVSGIIF